MTFPYFPLVDLSINTVWNIFTVNFWQPQLGVFFSFFFLKFHRLFFTVIKYHLSYISCKYSVTISMTNDIYMHFMQVVCYTVTKISLIYIISM